MKVSVEASSGVRFIRGEMSRRTSLPRTRRQGAVIVRRRRADEVTTASSPGSSTIGGDVVLFNGAIPAVLGPGPYRPGAVREVNHTDRRSRGEAIGPPPSSRVGPPGIDEARRTRFNRRRRRSGKEARQQNYKKIGRALRPT